MDKKKIERLPFSHCGIDAKSIISDEDGIRYTLDDGREILYPVTGGVWIDLPTGQLQVSGTCDSPFVRYL